jgi:hypothetical protein
MFAVTISMAVNYITFNLQGGNDTRNKTILKYFDIDDLWLKS